MIATRWRRPSTGLVVLACLAYLPALTAGWGRMPADTKLYLYLDPGRLISDAPYTFDGRQFAGWVPHQTISYLWPSGPWFWLFDELQVPDWIAHRLWIGTLLFVAGLGARWLAGMLGIGGERYASGAAVAVGAVYQLSPYVLPYLSRTSLMLLPFAGLGWIIGLTIKAATVSKWRHAAILALVVATVSAPNATATAMIVPAPLLWLLHSAVGGQVTWRRVTATIARVAALCIPVSLWWIVMLSVQGRYGANVLGFSETLEAVSLTSNSMETLRGMGYWLFYVRDPIGFTTSAAEAYMSSGILVVTSAALTAAGFVGLVAVRFRDRGFAILLVVVGTFLAIGVHPIDDPHPLLSPFAESSRSTWSLALRSSARALPMSVLGLALGAGALVAATSRRLPSGRRWYPAGGLIVLAVANLPVMFTGGFVDPVLTRDEQPPQAWSDAAASLDDRPTGYRVLQLPGSEFGAFTWGYTVDPPLPGLTERPLVTRDLLPLGSPAAMDLLYALDDRFQDGVLEPAAIAPAARLLGADSVWLTNDAWFDRFRTPRPDVVAQQLREDVAGLGDPVAFGEAAVVEAVQLESIDETSLGAVGVGVPVEPVWLVPVTSPIGVIRAKDQVTAIAGSGDGVIDASVAGLIDGTDLIVYTAELPEAARPGRLVVTDSNRDQARQWRGSQDTRGFTEDASGTALLDFDSADQRIDVFDDDDDHQTVAVQVGPVRAYATDYGEPFAYRPEHRAAMAVDGDIRTAWKVADRFDPTGEAIELRSDTAFATVTLLQPGSGATGSAPNRWITSVDIEVDDGAPLRVDLDDTSRTGAGQQIDLAVPARSVRVSIVTVAEQLGSGDGLVATGPDGVGFAEISTELGPSTEVVRPPIDWSEVADGVERIDTVLTRWRANSMNRWRSDPEPTLARTVMVPAPSTVDAVTIRLSARADDTVIAALFGSSTATASERLIGVPAAGGWAAVDDDEKTAWITPFGRPIGPALTVPATPGPLTPLTLVQLGGDYSVIRSVRLHGLDDTIDVTLPEPAADGSQLVDTQGIEVGDSLTMTILDADVRTTRDRRSAEVVALPAAVAELTGASLTAEPLPAGWSGGCVAVGHIGDAELRVEVPDLDVESFLAGEPVVVATCDRDTTDGALERRSGVGGVIVSSIDGLDTGLDVDRIVIGTIDESLESAPRAISADVIAQTRTGRTVTVGSCPIGCWIVLGEGLNSGWTAAVDGTDVGAGSLVDGGFNGWWLPPSGDQRTIEFRWGAQTPVTIALVISAMSIIGCIAIALIDRSAQKVTRARTPRFARVPWHDPPTTSNGRRAVALAAVLLAGGQVFGQGRFAAALTIVVLTTAFRPRLAGWLALAIWSFMTLTMLNRVVRYDPFPSGAWPSTFDDLHRWGIASIVLLACTLGAADTTASRAVGADNIARS